jgi:alpha-acetolactate decarboxylase
VGSCITVFVIFLFHSHIRINGLLLTTSGGIRRLSYSTGEIIVLDIYFYYYNSNVTDHKM